MVASATYSYLTTRRTRNGWEMKVVHHLPEGHRPQETQAPEDAEEFDGMNLDPHDWLTPGMDCQVKVLRYPAGTERVNTARYIWIPARFLFWLECNPAKALVALYPHETDPQATHDQIARPYITDSTPIPTTKGPRPRFRLYPIDEPALPPIEAAPEWIYRHYPQP